MSEREHIGFTVEMFSIAGVALFPEFWCSKPCFPPPPPGVWLFFASEMRCLRLPFCIPRSPERETAEPGRAFERRDGTGRDGTFRGVTRALFSPVRGKAGQGHAEKGARDGSGQRGPRQPSASRGQKSAKSSGSSSSSSQLASS